MAQCIVVKSALICKFSFVISYFVTFCLHVAKKDFDIIVSFDKLKSINLVIINADTISRQKFQNSRESPIHYGKGLSGYSKTI